MRSVVFVFLLSLVLAAAFQQAHAVAVGPNIEIAGEASPDRQRVEPTIAVDPRDPNIIVAGAQDLKLVSQGGHRWHGYYRSRDGGMSWSLSLLPGFPGDTSTQGMASPLRRFDALSDPVMAFDRAGSLYYTGIAFNITGSPGIVDFTSLRLFVAKFVHDGADYAGVTVLTDVKFADKPWIAVDTTGGRNDGNVYVAFDGPHGLVFTRSKDGGQTFSKPTPAPGAGTLAGVAVDPTGNIFISSIQCTKQNCNILVSKSTNGGLGFSDPTKAVARITPVFLPGNGFRTFTIPQIAADANGVDVVWDELDNGDAHVFLVHSTDGGRTWRSPVRVGDVATGQQFFPTIAVSGGVISVAWYDSRLNTCGPLICQLDVFYARSTDAGASFSTNLRVTDVPFNPNMVLRTDPPGTPFPFLGDYIQIAASPTVAHPIWADNRNACDTRDPTFGCVDQDLFTTTITL